jgi:hypothetical protein
MLIPVARAGAVNLVVVQEAQELAVKAVRVVVARAQAAQAAVVSQVRAVFRQVVQAKPHLSPVQALPMRRAEAQIVVVEARAVQVMAVAAAQVVSLEVAAVRVLL